MWLAYFILLVALTIAINKYVFNFFDAIFYKFISGDLNEKNRNR